MLVIVFFQPFTNTSFEVVFAVMAVSEYYFEFKEPHYYWDLI